MTTMAIQSVFLFFIVHLFMDFHACAVAVVVPYDYTYTIACMAEPSAPQYGGGIALNPEFDEGLQGWVGVGNADLALARSSSGNNYALVSNILQVQSDGVSQHFPLDKDTFYVVSAWIQASGGGSVDVGAKLVASTGNRTAGWITAKRGCWTMLKGGFSVNATEVAELRFESNGRGIDFWIDSVSVQSFTKEEWACHQDQSVDKVRKTRVRLEVGDENAAISFKQLQPYFPFGCVMNGRIVDNPAYQKWFLEKRFRYTAFENELKWQFTEKTEGVEDYSKPDAMLAFCKSNNLTVRGHNVLWDDIEYQADWVTNLTGEDRRRAAIKRVDSVVQRYRGSFIHWDVLNENLHYSFISSVTGNGTEIFELVRRLDPSPIPFLNEYNVVEDCSLVGKASPQRYLQKIDQLRDGGYVGPLGIGLESHFDTVLPMIPYVRATIDMLAATGLPIWITELTVNDTLPNHIEYLEMLLHELYSHPAVGSIIIWSSVGTKSGCYSMCLVDKYFKNLPPGDTVDKFMSEYINMADTNGMTDVDGALEVSLFYGEYEVTVTLPNGATRSHIFNLVPGDKDAAVLTLKI